MNVPKYRKGEIIKSVYEILTKEHIYIGDRIYPKQKWEMLQYRYIEQQIMDGNIYEAVPIKPTVYVCYENNHHQIEVENGSIQELTTYSKKEDSVKWAMERIDSAKGEGFVVDKEYGVVDENSISSELDKDDYFAVIMFAGHQDNFDESYDIVIEKREVK